VTDVPSRRWALLESVNFRRKLSRRRTCAPIRPSASRRTLRVGIPFRAHRRLSSSLFRVSLSLFGSDTDGDLSLLISDVFAFQSMCDTSLRRCVAPLLFLCLRRRSASRAYDSVRMSLDAHTDLALGGVAGKRSEYGSSRNARCCFIVMSVARYIGPFEIPFQSLLESARIVARDCVVTLYLHRSCDGIVLIKIWHDAKRRFLRASYISRDKLNIVLCKHNTIATLANAVYRRIFFLRQ